MVQEMGFLINNKIKQDNKNYPRREKQDSWQAWQGRTRQDTFKDIRRRTSTGLQTQDYKGSK